MSGTVISSTNLSDNPALLGKGEQFGKLAESINHFHLVQTTHTKIRPQLYFNGENRTFIWCSYHINRKNMLNKAFRMDTLRANKRPEAGE